MLNSRDKRLVQQDDYIERITQAAKAQSIYIVPIDQTFKKAQTARISIQSMAGIKKDTADTINLLACNLLGIKQTSKALNSEANNNTLEEAVA